jgi:hypothetical protein
VRHTRTFPQKTPYEYLQVLVEGQSPQVSFNRALHAFEHLDVRCLKADNERLGLYDQRGASSCREEDAPPAVRAFDLELNVPNACKAAGYIGCHVGWTH